MTNQQSALHKLAQIKKDVIFKQYIANKLGRALTKTGRLL